jgi:putative endonuclease
MYYVYILHDDNKRVYVGYTSNLRRRFREHNESPGKGYKSPFQLIYYEAYSSEEDARERELALKQFGNAYKQLKRRIKRSINL